MYFSIITGKCGICFEDSGLITVPLECTICRKFIYICGVCFMANFEDYFLSAKSHMSENHASIDVL